MIPIRLPWRPRARPSATLHEILVRSIKSKLGVRYYNRPSGLSRNFTAETPSARKRIAQDCYCFIEIGLSGQKDATRTHPACRWFIHKLSQIPIQIALLRANKMCAILLSQQPFGSL